MWICIRFCSELMSVTSTSRYQPPWSIPCLGQHINRGGQRPIFVYLHHICAHEPEVYWQGEFINKILSLPVSSPKWTSIQNCHRGYAGCGLDSCDAFPLLGLPQSTQIDQNPSKSNKIIKIVPNQPESSQINPYHPKSTKFGEKSKNIKCRS